MSFGGAFSGKIWLKVYRVSGKGKHVLKKKKKTGPKELSRLKSFLKVDGDVLMKDLQAVATVMEPKRVVKPNV